MLELKEFRMVFVLHVLGFLLLLISCIVQVVSGTKCPPSLPCGYVGNVSFPFTTTGHPECGIFVIHGCDDEAGATKSIQNNNRWFDIVSLNQSTITIRDNHLLDLLLWRSCEVMDYKSTFAVNSTLASSHLINSSYVLRCNHALDPKRLPPMLSNPAVCGNHTFYELIEEIEKSDYMDSEVHSYSRYNNLTGCSIINVPIAGPVISKGFNSLFNRSSAADIPIQMQLSPDCSHCQSVYVGQCRTDNYGKFYCDKGT